MKKRLTVLAALLACSTLMGSAHVYAEENEKNVVETAYGKVQGINSTDENYEDVVEFRGIPYATTLKSYLCSVIIVRMYTNIRIFA